MAPRSQITSLVVIGLISRVFAQSSQVILTAAEAIAFVEIIKNVAITGNAKGMKNIADLGYCSKSKPYVDSLLLILGEHLLQEDIYIQNTGVIAREKMAVWSSVNIEDANLNSERNKILDSVSIINNEYKNLLEIVSKNFYNFIPGSGNEDLNAEAVCKYSKTEVPTDVQASPVNNDFIPSTTYLDSVINDYANAGATICGRGSSLNSYFYGMYIETLLTHVKLFIIRVFSYYSLDKYNGLVAGCAYSAAANIEATIDDLFEKFKQNVNSDVSTFKANKVDRYVRSCDGPYLEEYSTHLELDGAIQSFAFIAKESPTKDCTNLPNMLQKNSKYYIPCQEHTTCSNYPKPCLGRLSKCTDIYKLFKKDQMAACMTDYGTKRFNWMLPDDGKNRLPSCNKNNYSTAKFHKDDQIACLCTCSNDDPDASNTHIISLQEVKADVEHNMVITGVRFTKQNGILYLQIQQGVLIENGKVENVGWKYVDDISDDVYKSRTNAETRREFEPFTEHKDFYLIKLDGTNSMNLGEVMVDDGHVVTGVRFVVDSDTQRFQIAVSSTNFDYRSGKLGDQMTSKTINHQINRQPIYGSEGKATKWNPPLLKSIHENAYVVFESSDMSKGPGEFGNHGQSTMPYLDFVPVEVFPPSPISGIGIFLKSNGEDSVAIVSPRLITIDNLQYVTN